MKLVVKSNVESRMIPREIRRAAVVLRSIIVVWIRVFYVPLEFEFKLCCLWQSQGLESMQSDSQRFTNLWSFHEFNAESIGFVRDALLDDFNVAVICCKWLDADVVMYNERRWWTCILSGKCIGDNSALITETLDRYP
jgi:hypothetical protein